MKCLRQDKASGAVCFHPRHYTLHTHMHEGRRGAKATRAPAPSPADRPTTRRKRTPRIHTRKHAHADGAHSPWGRRESYSGRESENTGAQKRAMIGRRYFNTCPGCRNRGRPRAPHRKQNQGYRSNSRPDMCVQRSDLGKAPQTWGGGHAAGGWPGDRRGVPGRPVCGKRQAASAGGPM